MISLKEQFANGQCPEPQILLSYPGVSCTWKVTMLSGLLPDLSWLNHIKICYPPSKAEVHGFNSLKIGNDWGYFKASLDVAPDGKPALLLDYSKSQHNGFIAHRIRDYVRVVDDLSLLGQFRYMISGKPRLLGYFRLDRL